MHTERGFTLVEVMVAMAILTIVLLGFLSTRSHAMADAIKARNWRLAREIAEEQLSKLMAGGNEFKPDPLPVDLEEYPGFRYRILIGDQAISEAEAELDNFYTDQQDDSGDRRLWQRERDERRSAKQKGVSLDDYRQQLIAKQTGDENTIPSESEYEEVAVIVYFPNVTLDSEDEKEEETYTLKAKVSTLAIHGMTPEQAQSLADARGVAHPDAQGGKAGGGANPGGGGGAGAGAGPSGGASGPSGNTGVSR
jgi:prepilin-type N-terminal cleavage/methylation domain-containing protein